MSDATDITSSERTFLVEGMSCGHCVAAVEAAVGALPDVERVTVTLDTGQVTVVGGADAAVRSAIEDEGYGVA